MREKKSAVRTFLKLILPFLFVCFIMLLKKDAYVGSYVTQYNTQKAENKSVSVKEESLIQSFSVKRDIIGMDIIVQSEDSGTAQFQLQLYKSKDDTLVDEQTVEAVLQSGENQLHFDVKLQGVEKDTKLYVKLSQLTEMDGVGISIESGTYKEKLMDESGEVLKGRCRFSVTHGMVFHSVYFILTAVVMYLGLLILVFRMDRCLSIEKLFLVVALSAGVLFACMNPAGQECDGTEHILRSIDVSYGNVLAPVVNLTHEKGKIIVPKNVDQMNVQRIEVNSGKGNSYQQNLEELHFSKETKEMAYESYFASIFYLPQGIGIWLGRSLGLNVYLCIVIGRVLNLGAYAALTYVAIKRLPMFKNLMSVIALLPLTLYQAASCSPDALLCGLCFLFVALCFQYAYDKTYDKEKQLGIKQAAGLGILLALIYMCKYVYVCLGLLVFMIPKERFGEKKQYWKSFITALLPLAIVAAGLFSTLTGTVGSVPEQAGEMSQFGFILQNPLHVVKALISTMEVYFSVYAEWLNTLGWLEYPLGPLLYIIPCFLVGCACLDTNEYSEKLKNSHKILCFVTFMVTYSAILLGMYIGDKRINPVGASLMLGGQGRYFIPLILLLGAALSSRKIENHIEGFSSKVTGCLGVFLAYAGIQLVNMCY